MDEGLSTGTTALLVVLVAVVLAVGVWVQTRREKKFRSDRKDFSRQGGWRRFPADMWTEDWQGPPFRPGRDNYAAEIMVTERDGLRVFFLEYVYLTTDQVRADGSRVKKPHLVVGVDLPASLPEITFERGVRAGLAAAVGAQDVQVGHPHIDDQWRITSADPEFARALVQGGVTHALARPELQGAQLRIVGSTLLWWEKGFDLSEVLLKVGRVEPALVELARAVPADVVRTYGTAPRPLLPTEPLPTSPSAPRGAGRPPAE